MTHQLNDIQSICTNLESDTEFVVGSIYGLRQWAIRHQDGLRKLVGHNYWPWSVEDENVAECHKNYQKTNYEFAVSPLTLRLANGQTAVDKYLEELFRNNPAALGASISLDQDPYGAVQYVAASPEVLRFSILKTGITWNYPSYVNVLNFRGALFTAPDDHEIVQPSCTCGFYAYTDSKSLEQNSLTDRISVFGIIEAYGKVTQGTKGFRAEKARVRALTQPLQMRQRTYRELQPVPQTATFVDDTHCPTTELQVREVLRTKMGWGPPVFSTPMPTLPEHLSDNLHQDLPSLLAHYNRLKGEPTNV